MRELILAYQGEMALKGLNRATFESIPVSYTHLDVYKRQALARTTIS